MSDVPPPPAPDPAPPPASPPPEAPLPRATLRPARRLGLGWFWLLPLVVLAVVTFVVWQSLSQRGPRIVVAFKEGHGLKPGDSLRHRGITVGEVRSVELSPDLKGVVVTIDLQLGVEKIAVEDSRFWIVRPQANLSGLSGLETVMGAKYVAVRPGSGASKRHFVGDEEPVPDEEPGGLRIVVQDKRTGGLRPGSPLTYRGVRIGDVVSSGLASDASAVEIHVHVRPAYKDLVRDNSKFWNVSGFKAFLSGWKPTVEAESPETILVGGMAMATQPPLGKPVSDFRRFALEDKEPEGWQDWNPSIPLVNPNLPVGKSAPKLVRAALKYQVPGRFWGTNPAERRGLLLPVDGTWLLGPEDLLSQPADAVIPPPVELTFEGTPEGTSQMIPASKTTGSLRWLKTTGKPLEPSLSMDRLRPPRKLENCLLVAGSPSEPSFVSESHLRETETGWLIRDNAPSAGLARQTWHGAAVVSVEDGKVIGLLVAPENGPKRIVPLTEELLRK